MKFPFFDKEVDPADLAFLIVITGGVAFLLSVPLMAVVDKHVRIKTEILSCRSFASSKEIDPTTLDKVCGKLPK